MKKNIGDDYIICPFCGTPQDRYTLYKYDCICMDCGGFIDMDDYDYGEDYPWGSSDWDDYDYEKDDMYIEYMKRHYGNQEGKGKNMNDTKFDLIDKDDEQIGTFVLRFITSADYETIKKSFETLDASIEFMSLVGQEGPISKFLKTASGQKLAKGLDIKSDIDEYVVQASFIFGDDGESKKTLISTLCKAFPLFIVREEDSSYIMANNKGLAKGFVELCNEDEIEILSMFLTGYEKYKILVNYLYWCEPYKNSIAKDIMVQWDNNSLIGLDTLRKVDEVPIIWQEYLATLDDIKVSKDDKDNGTVISFEQMLEDVVEDGIDKKDILEEENLIQVVSLRGVAEYALGGDADDEIKE